MEPILNVTLLKNLWFGVYVLKTKVQLF